MRAVAGSRCRSISTWARARTTGRGTDADPTVAAQARASITCASLCPDTSRTGASPWRAEGRSELPHRQRGHLPDPDHDRELAGDASYDVSAQSDSRGAAECASQPKIEA